MNKKKLEANIMYVVEYYTLLSYYNQIYENVRLPQFGNLRVKNIIELVTTYIQIFNGSTLCKDLKKLLNYLKLQNPEELITETLNKLNNVQK